MTANVRRDGQRVEVPAEELVPGDIVGFEAGDKVPADGRILVAATLEIEEAGLTGESTPVAKVVDPVAGDDAPLGDRIDMAYMNSQVTRGRGEMVVTATGMSSEVGHISGMLSGVEQEKTPLTKQLDQLTVLITIMAAAALVLIVLLGLARGEDFDDLFLVGISLAIAAIPTGLPAVVTMLLSVGTQELAEQGAIVKRLRSVETLGSTSAICSDKTGTLTLNQMTARELVVVGRRFSVDGEGYSTTGRILRVAGRGEGTLEPFMLPMALANDAVIRDGACIGDPTEGALVVLAAKGGLDVEETRRRTPVSPRCRSTPSTSSWRRSTRWRRTGRTVVRCFVKGAPDVLLARSSRYLDADGSIGAHGRRDRIGCWPRTTGWPAKGCGCSPSRGATSILHLRPGGRPPGAGRRSRPARPRRHRRPAPQGGEGRDRPLQGRRHPRPDDHRRPRHHRRRHRRPARHRRAGAHRRRVRRDLRRRAPRRGRRHRRRRPGGARGQGPPGQHPQAAGKHRGHDRRRCERAPALTRADIGVAMGITGTEVTKDAAEMILTDDNFATIVTAVEGGRGLYDNLMKYVRVQMIMLAGFILLFVGAGIFDIANGSPLLPLQILWINFAIDVLLALGLGFDAPTPGLMRRRPRSPDEPSSHAALGVRLGIAGLLIAIGTLVVVAWGEDRYGLAAATTWG